MDGPVECCPTASVSSLLGCTRYTDTNIVGPRYLWVVSDMTHKTIGVDARSIVGERSGVGNYLAGLLQEGAFGGATVIAYYDPTEGTPPEMLSIEETTDVVWKGITPPTGVTALMGRASAVWWLQLTLARRLRRDDVDLFFGPNFVQPLGTCTRSVVVVHDLTHLVVPDSHDPVYRWYLRAFLRPSLSRANHVVVVSEHTRDDVLRTFDLDAGHVTVAPGAAADRFKPRTVDDDVRCRLSEKYDLPERFLLYVGNVEPRKNLDTLLRALAEFDDTDRPPLVIAGQRHASYPAFDRALEEYSSVNDVRWIGYVDEEDLPLLYNVATVFVYPSLYEGFGLPVLEAMQSGLPVVTSNRGSLPEVAGESGETVDPACPRALKRAVTGLWSDSQERERARATGLDRAEQFSWQHTAETVRGVIEASLE